MQPNVYAACKQYGLNRIAVRLQPRIPIKSFLQPATLYGSCTTSEHADYSHRDGSAWKTVYELGENNKSLKRAMLCSHVGIDHPDLLRTLVGGGASAVDERFANALKLPEDSEEQAL